MGVLDYSIAAVYVALIFAMGLYFSRRQTSTDEYFVASRNLPGWVLGFSLIGTLIGSSTFIGHPGEVFRKNMWAMPLHLMLFPIALFIGMYLVVFYRRILKMSAYEYLEKRFGYPARVYGGVAFLLNRLVKISATFFFLAVAIAYLTGWDIRWIIVTVGVCTVAYTLLGGIRGVVWMDFIQTLVLLGGLLLLLGLVLFIPEAGPAKVISTAWQGGKFAWGDFHFSWVKDNVWIYFAVGIVWALSRFGTDQHIIQRYLAAKNDREAKRAAYIGAWSCVPIWFLAWFIGACMWSFYKLTPNVISPEIVADKASIVPYFIRTQVPSGLIGLIIAGLFSAAMSNLDSDLNSIAAVGVADYYVHFRPGSSDRARLLVGRLIVCVVGGASIVAAMFWTGAKSPIDFLMTLISLATAGVFGLFVLGIFFRFGTPRGALAGIIACVAFTVWGTLTAIKIPLLHRVVLDLGRFNFGLNAKLIGVFSHLILLGVGLPASLLLGGRKVDYTRLTIWAKKKDVAQ